MFKVSIIQMALQKTIDLLQAFITINKILFFLFVFVFDFRIENIDKLLVLMGFPGGSDGKVSAFTMQCR